MDFFIQEVDFFIHSLDFLVHSLDFFIQSLDKQVHALNFLIHELDKVIRLLPGVETPVYFHAVPAGTLFLAADFSFFLLTAVLHRNMLDFMKVFKVGRKKGEERSGEGEGLLSGDDF